MISLKDYGSDAYDLYFSKGTPYLQKSEACTNYTDIENIPIGMKTADLQKLNTTSQNISNMKTLYGPSYFKQNTSCT
jgi:hypothetical protein